MISRQLILNLILKSLLAIILFIGIKACQSVPSQLNQYPFFDSHQLTGADQFSSWWKIVIKHRKQSSMLEDCQIQPRKCQGKLRSYGHVLQQAKSLAKSEQIELVHHYINRTNYDEDKVMRHYDHKGHQKGVTRSSWKTLYDFLINGGDCEDYATAKYFMLKKLGFNSSDMRIVVVYSEKLFGYHAVVAVRQPDDSIWLLDSEYPIKKRSHMGYRYIYAMNENNVWDHRNDFLETIKE